jgi:hypothetical protein
MELDRHHLGDLFKPMEDGRSKMEVARG